MMLLDRRRRPCFWVLGDNRCGPSISGEKEMARGTSREDLEELDASVAALEKAGELEERVAGRRKGKGAWGIMGWLKGGTRPRTPELQSGGSAYGVTGLVSLFFFFFGGLSLFF